MPGPTTISNWDANRGRSTSFLLAAYIVSSLNLKHCTMVLCPMTKVGLGKLNCVFAQTVGYQSVFLVVRRGMVTFVVKILVKVLLHDT